MLTLPGTAGPILNPTGVRKMVKDINEANHIVGKMAKERNKTIGDILSEFLKWGKNGECQHFWPDENTACRMLIERRANQ